MNTTVSLIRAALTLLVCLLSACAVPPAQPDAGSTAPQLVGSSADLQGGDWVATAIAGVDTVTSPAPRVRWSGAEYV